MRTVSLKLPAELDAALDRLARDRGTTRSELVREAIEAYTIGRPRPSVTALAGNLVGSLEGGPVDLSTHPRHLRRYGQ